MFCRVRGQPCPLSLASDPAVPHPSQFSLPLEFPPRALSGPLADVRPHLLFLLPPHPDFAEVSFLSFFFPSFLFFFLRGVKSDY